jgi:hypothetical protein
MDFKDKYKIFVDKYFAIAESSEQRIRELLENEGDFQMNPVQLMSAFIERLIDTYISDKSGKVVEFWAHVMHNNNKHFDASAVGINTNDYQKTRYCI